MVAIENPDEVGLNAVDSVGTLSTAPDAPDALLVEAKQDAGNIPEPFLVIQYGDIGGFSIPVINSPSALAALAEYLDQWELPLLADKAIELRDLGLEVLRLINEQK